MKNIFKILLVCILFASCEETESVLFDGATGIGFGTSILAVSVPEEGITIQVPVLSTTTSTEARTFTASAVAVDPETDLTSSDYTIGDVTIPANSFEGTLAVTFNYNGLIDFQPYTLGVKIDAPGSAFPPITFNVLKEFDITTYVCADLTLLLNEDAYADERNWEITNSSGVVVAQCSDFTTCPNGAPSGSLPAAAYSFSIPTLPAGNYTFTIYDAYGDGQFDGNNEGNYDLFCSAQTVVSYASGGGDWGASESTDFTIVE